MLGPVYYLDGVAELIDGPEKVGPLSAHLHVGFIDGDPARGIGAAAAAKGSKKS